MTTPVYVLTLSLPSCPLPGLVGPRVSLLAGPLRGIRWLHLEQIGDNVVKGEAIQRQNPAVSVGVRLHVPSLNSVLDRFPHLGSVAPLCSAQDHLLSSPS